MAKRFRKKPKTAQSREAILEITHLGQYGQGFAKDDQGTYYIPYSLPGETVRAEISGKKAKLIEVIKASPERIEPFCPHFSRCGGCSVQHMEATNYLKWKQGIVETALNNKELDTRIDTMIDAHGDGRRRVTFHAQFKKGGVVVAGFMEGSSHNLINIESCPILAPELDTVGHVARTMARPFAANNRTIDLQITATETGLECDIRGAGEMSYDVHVGLSEAADECDITRVSINGEMGLERRRAELTMGKAKVMPPQGGFLQATRRGEDVISDLVLEHIGDAKNVIDLFCGVGPYTLRLASNVASVTAYDSHAPSINALTEAFNHTPGLKPVKAHVVDLFREPVPQIDLNKFDAIIFNPPRAGAKAQAEEIAISKVPIVVAVSCDPASFARDADILTDRGYILERVTPVDQFKYSAHVELVALFRLAS